MPAPSGSAYDFPTSAVARGHGTVRAPTQKCGHRHCRNTTANQQGTSIETRVRNPLHLSIESNTLEVNCCGAMVLKPICTSCHRGLKPSRQASRLVFDGSSLGDTFSLSGGSCSPFLNACKPLPRWPSISGRRPGPKTTRETVHALLLYEPRARAGGGARGGGATVHHVASQRPPARAVP